MYVYTHVCMYIYICIYVCLYINIYVYVRLCIYIEIISQKKDAFCACVYVYINSYRLYI